MLNKWFGEIDFGKLALETSSGFIVTTAIMFILDAFTPGHLTEKIFADASAGSIVTSGLVIIVGSSIFGLMVDSLFHSFGRYFARKFWRPLRYEFTYRRYCMNDLGLLLRDFEWIYANSKDKLSNEVEKDYLRFTEVAGSAAYAMLLLLSPASLLFLRLEYHQSSALSMVMAIFIAAGAFVLLLTSAESLSKYEKKKTANAMDDMRRLGPFFHADIVKTEEEDKKMAHWWSWREQKNHWWSPKLLWLLVIIALAGILLLFSNNVAINQLLKEKPMTTNVTTDKPKINTENVTDVPTIVIAVKKTLATPGDQAASEVITLKGDLAKSANITLKDTDLFRLVNLLNRPKWNLSVSLFNTTDDTKGARAYINIFLSFNAQPKEDPLKRIPAGEIEEGDWFFPIIVTADSKPYLLAQVQVVISSNESGANGNGGQTENTTPGGGGASQKSK